LNPSILTEKVQQFIDNNLNKDITKLILAGSPFKNINIQELANQITSKAKCKKKLPTWFNTKQIFYPKKINIEQTSSEITALYKSNLVSGDYLLDVTGGFGVDSYYFSKKVKNVIYCDLNEKLTKIVKHNYKKLGVEDIEVNYIDGLNYLKQTNLKFNWIYIDPSRRNELKGKVFLLKDCSPNVPINIDLLFEKATNILIKVSPLLDITSIKNELKNIKEIHVIAVKNEVKELLIWLKPNYSKPIVIKTTNIKNTEIIHFDSEFKSHLKSTFSEPLTYLFEPNNAILKAGLFNVVSHKLNINKLHVNSHLYTSNKLINFPGRKFKILNILSFDTKKLTKFIPEKKANITTRNFPLSVAQIRKKIKFLEGGKHYLFFTTNFKNKPIVLHCKKI